jgi:hypothetical protein
MYTDNLYTWCQARKDLHDTPVKSEQVAALKDKLANAEADAERARARLRELEEDTRTLRSTVKDLEKSVSAQPTIQYRRIHAIHMSRSCMSQCSCYW